MRFATFNLSLHFDF